MHAIFGLIAFSLLLLAMLPVALVRLWHERRVRTRQRIAEARAAS